MGCTRTYTTDDHLEAMKSLGLHTSKPEEPLTREQRAIIRAGLHRSAASKTLLTILNNPKNKAHKAVRALLKKSIQSKMTDKERELIPDAFRVILTKHPTAMGLFMKGPSERAPGMSAVQHHYEVLCAAALIEGKYKTKTGKTLSVNQEDRLDFGMKMAAGYHQPKRYGTIEADILAHMGTKIDMVARKPAGIFLEKTVGIDAKYSQTGKYSAKETKQEKRQLEGIRTGFRDGKLDEFVFITNGVFTEKFKEKVDQCNVAIARDFMKNMNISIAETPRELLTDEEKRHQPATPVPEHEFQEDRERLSELVSRYEIPQIDLCEHVTFNNYNQLPK